MKRVLSMVLLTLILAMTGFLSAQGPAQNHQGRSVHLGALAHFEGTVTAVNMEPGAGFPSFSLQTDAAGEVVIQTGPYWYFDTNDFTLAVLDQVVVDAFAPVDPANPIYYAALITNITTSFELRFRDDDGLPLWTGGRQHGGKGSGNAGQNSSSQNGRGQGGRNHGAGQATGTCVDLTAMTEVHGTITTVSLALGQRRSFFVLESDSGAEYTINAGPVWYFAANEFIMTIGDVVTAVIAPCSSNPMEWTAFQIENETTGETIVLRDENGVPLWIANR